MGPHERMAHRWIAIDFRLGRRRDRLRPGSRTRLAGLRDALHRIGQGLPGRGGAGELGVPQREPVQLGDLDGVQDGPAGGLAV